MSDKIKNIVNTVMLLLIVVGFFAANLILPDGEISASERRALKQKPEASASGLLEKRFYADVEEYALDQFLLRDAFRGIKAFSAYNLLGLSDSNGIYLSQGHVFKTDFPLSEENIVRAANRFNLVCDTYFEDKSMSVYYSVIPDKNYFANGHLKYDYGRLLQIMDENVNGMAYTDLFGTLTVADYYRTDLHWKQESIALVAQKLLASMGKGGVIPTNYAPHTLEPFRGAYFGQAAIPLKPDILTYLTNGTIDGARAYYHAFSPQDGAVRIEMPVYDTDAFGGVDPYSLFLGGPKMIVELENPQNPGGGELYIFRDSFSSSLAPLMLEGYSKITLIDMRYIRYSLYEMFISFTPGSDILFLLNTQALNYSAMFQ
ncbi:MAG: DHHW family protein [Firmicutes bacterium]|nr:DHHW family protein [Bacillota bacterium]